MKYSFETIGVVHSCFKEKFGIPRQPGLVREARATLELLPPYDRVEALKGIEAFSHVWILFVFHAIPRSPWKATVRPPRLGGNQRVGVFATRSTFRPNPIGMSVVALEEVVREGGRLMLRLKGIDLLDGTPVLDIKPYIPYADAIPQARAGFAQDAPGQALRVVFGTQAVAFCEARAHEQPGLSRFIEQLLAQDPRPAYVDEDGRIYGMRLFDFDLRWQVNGDTAEVLSMTPVSQQGRDAQGQVGQGAADQHVP